MTGVVTMEYGRFNIVIGGQAGSESKGKMSLYLANRWGVEVVCMASSPNAGHTCYVNGERIVTHHIPSAAFADHGPWVLLGPTSVIDLDRFLKEVNLLRDPSRVFVHPRAIMLRRHYQHMERERGLLKIGSTNQGVGVARCEKIMRGDITCAEDVREMASFIGDTVGMLNECMDAGKRYTVLCETTQGFDLDLEHGIDRTYCTSKMINPAMAMAEAGVSPWRLGHVYGVIRPYPIRVNNREGSSGPYADAKEITWEDVRRRSGAPHDLTELTTTTRLPRRVFEFSHERMKRFVEVCRPDYFCLQFANYIKWADYGKTEWKDLSEETKAFCARLTSTYQVPVAYVGTSETHMVDTDLDRLEGKPPWER